MLVHYTAGKNVIRIALSPRTIVPAYPSTLPLLPSQPLSFRHTQSFSHEAAVKQFGASVSYENLRTIDGVFEEVGRGHVDYGLVPCVSERGRRGWGRDAIPVVSMQL